MAFSASEYMKLRQQRLSGTAAQSSQPAAAFAPADDFSSKYLTLRQERIAKDVKAEPNRVVSNINTQSNSQENKRTWFKAGEFRDGYQFGDVTKTILGTEADIVEGLQAGILGAAEGVVDTGAYIAGGIGGLLGANDFKDNMEEFIKQDLIAEREIAKKANLMDVLLMSHGTNADNSSLLGDKSDSLVQSGGQLLATAGLQTVGVPWFVTTGFTSFGGEADNALNQGATFEQAGVSAAVSAGAEILTEKLFGGSGLGEKGLINLEPLTAGISRKLVKALSDFGIDMASEGIEEVVSQFASSLGSKLYREENLSDILFSEEAIDSYIESFISGAAMGGFANVRKLSSSIKDARSNNPSPQQATAQPSAAGMPETGEDALTIQVPGAEPSAPSQAVTDLVDEAIARATNAPADPLSAAVDGFKANGTVTNKQAQDILNNTKAVTALLEQTGIKLPDTASGRRNAVKQAVAQLAQQAQDGSQTAAQTATPSNPMIDDLINALPGVSAEASPAQSQTRQELQEIIDAQLSPTQNAPVPIDTAQNSDYDDKNTTGGITYADAEHRGLSGASEAGLPGGTGAERLRGTDPQQIAVSGQTSGEVDRGAYLGSGGLEGEPGSSGFEVQLRDSPLLRVSDSLAAAQRQNGTKTYPVRDTTSQPQVYADALTAGRSSDPANGWCVTPKSAQEIQEEGVRTFMNDTGTVGVGIARNGDIVAVFKNQNGGPARALDTMMPIAIEQGGDRLDCYGEGLVRTYENYGFIPVARVEFNSEYANDGWTADKGTPYIYFMMHNGDTADQVASNIRKYPHATQEQLDDLPTYGKDDYGAAMAYRDSLLDDGPTDLTTQPPSGPTDAGLVDTQSTEGVAKAPETSVGAAPADFTGKAAYNDLLHEGNVQPDRPGDVRPMEVPRTDSYGRHVSETAANLYGAEITPDETASRIEELIAMGALGFDTKTNKQMVEEAAAAIKKKGVAVSEKAVTKAVFSGKAQDSDIVTAALLYTTYANRKGEAAQDKAAELAVDLATMANDAGRRLQLFKLIRKLTPQGQLMAVKKGVERSLERINKGRGKNNQAEVTIPQELVDEYLDAAQRDIQEQTEETAKQKEEIEQTIYKAAAAQIKASPMEKLNAWRYMAMLGNAKTQARNYLGNAAFRSFVSVKRAVGAVMEQVFVEQENRTKSILGLGKDAKSLVKWAREDAKSKSTQQLLSYSGLTGDTARNAVEQERRIYDTKWLEATRQFVQKIPEGADMIFKSREYAYSLASFVKARGYSFTDITAGKVPDSILEEGRSYAAQEALKATFNDHNIVSDILSKRYNGNNSFVKAVNLMAEGILPFRRTPANILVRGIEYSPANIVRSAWNLCTKVRKGDMSAATAIDQMASGLTGTAAIALGYALAAGVFGFRLRGKIEDEDELRTGHQEYAFEIGDRSYTVDWLAPTNIPLFIGANIYELQNGEGDVGWFASALNAAGTSLEPMLELSCLSSLNDLIQGGKYAEEGTELWTVAATAATSYLTQYIPTLFGQLEQATEEEKKSAYSSADTPVERSVQKSVGRITQRVPGMDLFQAGKYDEWGNKAETDGVFQAFGNPSYVKKITDDDPVEKEISRLNKTQGKNISPSKPPQTISYEGPDGEGRIKRRLTAEEYETLCRVQGKNQRRLVEDILDHKDYAWLSDKDKAKVISCAYDYAAMCAKSAVVDYHEEPSYITNRPEGMSEAEAILRHTLLGSSTAYADLPIRTGVYVKALVDAITPETKADGTAYTNVRPIQKMEAVVADDRLDAYADALLREYLDEGPERRYDAALTAGFTDDQFVEAYRQYLDTEGENKQQAVIRYIQREMGMSYASAKKLYTVLSSRTTSD